MLSNVGGGCVCALWVFTTAGFISIFKCGGWLCLCSLGVHHCWTCLCYQTCGMVVFVFFRCSPLLGLSVLSNVGDGCVCALLVFTTAVLVSFIKCEGWLCLCSSGVHHCLSCLCYKRRGWLCLCSSGIHHCCSCQFYQMRGIVVLVFFGCLPLLDLSVLSSMRDC